VAGTRGVMMFQVAPPLLDRITRPCARRLKLVEPRSKVGKDDA